MNGLRFRGGRYSPDCYRNREIRYYPDQAGSRLRESPSFPRKRESTGEEAGETPAFPGDTPFSGSVDSRFLPVFTGMTGNDGLKTTISACGLSSLAVNLSHTLFRPENPVFCAANVRMGRHFMELTGSLVRGAARTPRRAT